MKAGCLTGWVAIAVTCLFGATACQTSSTTASSLDSKSEKTQTPTASVEPAPLAAPDLAPQAAAALEPIYFDFDSWRLRDDARLTLKENAQKIQSDPDGGTLTIEGHCDERGDDGYNLALGDRRAAAVARYLADLGVPGSRLQTISLGESQPAAMGHDESAWRLNRRAEIRVASLSASR